MKLTDYIAIIVIVALAYFFIDSKMNPKVVIQTELIKGDTVAIVETKTIRDTVYQYVYKAIKDTTIIHDTTYIAYSSQFNLGDSVLGTSGKVSFDLIQFKFSDVKYRYPEIIKSVTDTLKVTEQIEDPFYFNEWFYTTLALLIAIVAGVGG